MESSGTKTKMSGNKLSQASYREESIGSHHSRGGNKVSPSLSVLANKTAALEAKSATKKSGSATSNTAQSVDKHGCCKTHKSGDKHGRRNDDKSAEGRKESSSDDWSLVVLNTSISPLCHIVLLVFGILLLFSGVLLIALAVRESKAPLLAPGENHSIIELWGRQKKGHCLQAGVAILIVAALFLIIGVLFWYKRRQLNQARLRAEKGLPVYNVDVNSFCPTHRQEFLREQTLTEELSNQDYGTISCLKRPIILKGEEDKRALLKSNRQAGNNETSQCSECWNNWYRPPEKYASEVISFPS